MDALLYLLVMRLKNRVLSLLRSPKQYGLALTAAAQFFLKLFAGSRSADAPAQLRSRDELYAAITLLYAAIFMLSAYNGFLKSTALFSMADAHLIFISPITKNKALVYGLVQQAGVSLTIGLSILYQYSWLRAVYGITFRELMFILAGFAVTLFLGQLTAMYIYVNTSAKPFCKKVCKFILLTVGIAPFITACVRGLTTHSGSPGAVLAAVNDLQNFFFISGWICTIVTGLSFGKPFAPSFVAVVCYAILPAILLLKSKQDYYEDVLQAAELEYRCVAARREGKFHDVTPQRIKLGKVGLTKGFGASALYYKHKLESRRAKTFLLDTMTLLFIGIDLLAAIFLRNIGLTAVVLFATYMQIFTVALGRWAKELVLPYIYLMTDPPFIKLLHCLREPLKKTAVEAVVLYLPISLLFNLSLVEAVALVITRISFGWLFLSGCILIERFFNGITLRPLALVLYFLCMLLLSLPGLTAALILILSGYPLPQPAALLLLTITACNLLVSMIALYVSRNMLEYAEINRH